MSVAVSETAERDVVGRMSKTLPLTYSRSWWRSWSRYWKQKRKRKRQSGGKVRRASPDYFLREEEIGRIQLRGTTGRNTDGVPTLQCSFMIRENMLVVLIRKHFTYILRYIASSIRKGSVRNSQLWARNKMRTPPLGQDEEEKTETLFAMMKYCMKCLFIWNGQQLTMWATRRVF